MNLNQITEPLVNKKIREAKRNQKGSKLFVGERTSSARQSSRQCYLAIQIPIPR